MSAQTTTLQTATGPIAVRVRRFPLNQRARAVAFAAGHGSSCRPVPGGFEVPYTQD